MPIWVRPTINFANGTSTVNVTIGSKMREQKPIEDVIISIPFPKEMLSSNLTTNVGAVTVVETASGVHKVRK